jgi:hypothetical protein
MKLLSFQFVHNVNVRWSSAKQNLQKLDMKRSAEANLLQAIKIALSRSFSQVAEMAVIFLNLNEFRCVA